MVKVSVIIPVYNSESFIRQCIHSVLSQTYRDWELILIDDGSADQSRGICEELCLKDERIRLYSREHKGVSSARNHGLDNAVGEYVFFLDSDDAIHLHLLERLVQKAEANQADLAFCTCKRLESLQMEEIINRDLENSVEARSEVGEKKDSGEWFHRKYARELTCIGGKLIRKGSIGTLRFDESLNTGEDTVFMYFLISSRIRMVYYHADWYYYRMHPKSITHCDEITIGQEYFKKYEIIRDSEYQRKRYDTAFGWEKRFFGELENKYLSMKSVGDADGVQRIRKMAAGEMKHPLFRKFSIKMQIYYFCFFFYNRFYSFLSRRLWLIRLRRGMIKEYADVGVLTFHCADDYGAMLQAYALKNYLCGSGIQADIIRYEPFFMAGRYWWIPYVPVKGLAGILYLGWRGWKEHCSMGKGFFALRNYMKHFRKEYLVDVSHKKLLFCSQFKSLPYRKFIVGSDQIWNPEITYGLRKGYFGAFESRRKEKVIAYAASLGGEKLAPAHTRKFSKLLESLDAVSMREEEAIPYVRECYKGTVKAVCDPVFLLERSEWVKIEKMPDRTGYIFIYATQMNHELTDYARKLSREKGLPVVELRTSTSGTGESFPVDYAAGPAEFLGYIHKADYIVTNSFHAAAFSIIYQKKFLVFLHRSRGARLRDMLSLCGLEGRLYQESGHADIDSEISWCDVMLNIKESVKASGEFLKKNLS